MLEFKMDRRVFYGLLTVLGVGLALGWACCSAG